MPDGITAEQMVDAVVATRNYVVAEENLNGQADGFSYLFSADQPRKWEVVGPLMQDNKAVVRGGPAIDWYSVYREYGSAKFVLPGQVYQPSVVNVLVKGTAPWRYMHFDYSMLRAEIMANRTPEKLIDIFKPRRASAKIDAAKLIEAEFWADPVYGSTTQPLTASYWVVPIHGYQVTDSGSYSTNKWGEFQGGLPNNAASFSDIAGIDPGGAYTQGSGFASSTYSRHRNWNFTWSNSTGTFTDTDCKNLGHALDALEFDVPFMVPELNKAKYDKQRLCSCQVVKDSIEAYCRNGNDSTGMDVAKYQNGTLFRGLPIRWIKALDTASTTYRGTYPIYGFNWANAKMFVREGEYFLEQTFGPDKYMPDATTTHSDLTYQIIATNRQQFGFVGSYVAAAT